MTAYKLDLKDRKILYELDANARQSCSQIGKKLRLSPEVVNYRIKRLEEEKIITHYQLIVNLSKLDILQFKICLAFQHLDSKNLEKIILKLKEHDSVKWIVSCEGNWDLIISLETDSLENMDLLKDEIIELFQGFLIKKEISILVEAITFNRDYLIDDKNALKKSRIIMKKDKPVKVDDIDLAILKKLSENSRKPIIELAQELKTTSRIVNYRVKQLIKNKLILGFKMAINYEKLGIRFFKAFIYLENPNKERVQALKSYFGQHPFIIHHVKVFGSWDLEPEFEVYSEKEFRKIISEIKDKFSDIIRNIELVTISEEHKFVYF